MPHEWNYSRHYSHGPSNINLVIFVCSWMFAGLYNQSPLLTMVFGTFISYDKVGNEWKNVAKKVDNLNTKPATWQSLKHSLFGWCSLAKTVGLSGHSREMCICNPLAIFFQILWKNKRDKIKRCLTSGLHVWRWWFAGSLMLKLCFRWLDGIFE